jgi:YbbR domain-containing protein
MIKFVLSFIKEDFFRKLIALAFALLVWWKISLQIGVEETIRNIPVRIIDNPNLISMEESVKHVDITVKTASQRSRKLLSASDFAIEIRLPGKKSGTRQALEYKIARDADIAKPFGVKIVNFNPDKIIVPVDRRTQKEIPVAARFTGNLSEDFACGEVRLNPSKIVADGPETVLAAMTRVQTDPIALDSAINGDFESYARVSQNTPKVTFTPEKITAHVEIYKKYDKRTFSALPISVMSNPGSSFNIKNIMPTNVDVTVSGQKSVIEAMNGTELQPFIRRNDIKVGQNESAVECYIGIPGVKLVSIEPEKAAFSSAGEK